MSADKVKRPNKLIKWIFWRIPIALMIFSAVFIVALLIVEKYPDPLRQGFEQYLTRATGRNATIGVLEEIKFFPNFIFHANNITAHNRANAAEIDLEIEELKINAPFSSVFFGRRKINDFTLTNLTAQKGMFGPKAVQIDTANIVVREEGDNPGSFIISQGQYGEDTLYFEGKLKAGKYHYQIPINIPFLIKIGTYELRAKFKRGFTEVVLENMDFRIGEQKSAIQDYILSKDKGYNLDNPLTCILTAENLEQCNKYLKNNNLTTEN